MGKTARNYLSKRAKKEAKGIVVAFQEDQEKYSKKQFIQVYKGYDFLENILTVRTYIQKRYNIDWPTLELLLKLMGMRAFTRLEYSEVPRDLGFNRFNTFLELGYVSLLSDHTDVERRLFILSTKGKNIVTNFYMYLSGEKKIPVDGQKNPMANSNKQVAYDKKKLEMIKKMNSLPIPEHTKKLFM